MTVDPVRYLNDREQLANLAVWLRDNRAGSYPVMIAKGQINESDAFRDELARACIAADWIAVADKMTRDADPHCPIGWCIWALEQALAGQQRRVDRMRASDQSLSDHVDLRDAIAALLHHYRSGFIHLLIGEAALRGRHEGPAAAEAA